MLAKDADSVPKSGDATVEMIRALRVARGSAIKAKRQTINTMKALVVTAPDELRESLRNLTAIQLVRHCSRFKSVPVRTPEAATKVALRSLGQRHTFLEEEIERLDASLDVLVTAAAPALVDRYGIGTDTAGALLVAAGDNPDRLRSESAFPMLCGASPVQASSGMKQRHRLNRGGDRQANAALHRIVVVRLRYDSHTRDYMGRRLAEGKTRTEVIRCLKRYVAREVFGVLRARTSRQASQTQPNLGQPKTAA